MIAIPRAPRRPHSSVPAEVLSVLTDGDEQWTDYRGSCQILK